MKYDCLFNDIMKCVGSLDAFLMNRWKKIVNGIKLILLDVQCALMDDPFIAGVVTSTSKVIVMKEDIFCYGSVTLQK